jgi:hypothetical protein
MRRHATGGSLIAHPKAPVMAVLGTGAMGRATVEAAGGALPMATAACQAHVAACASGWADYDCAAIAAALTHEPVPETTSSHAGG